jgi:short-subunit dehydrogenase
VTHVLITGASSGIGAALARAYARPGATLSLAGRDRSRLSDVAMSCRQRGATADESACDVGDRSAMESWIETRDRALALDVVIANAGISAGTGGGHEPPDQTRRIFATNIDGTVNTVLPAVACMRPRRRGQIAIISSLAGYRGMPGAPAYSASKAAIKVWGEGLRGALARDGISVSVVCPGFVVSGITRVNRFPMPFLMDADRAARVIVDGLAHDKGRIAFPWPMAALAWLGATLPNILADLITRSLPSNEHER